MSSKITVLGAATIAALMAVGPVSADALRSNVTFNNSIGEKTSDQPANGVKVAYQITLQGGDFDGCTVDIVESLYGRDEGAWGTFDIAGELSCDNGKFGYTTSGAWDDNGFHAAGDINAGSGSGDFSNIEGRVIQLGGGAAAASDGTLDIHYELVVDKNS